MSSNTTPHQLMTVPEVAEYLRIAPATLRWWRHSGEGGPRSFNIGRRVMYSRAEVEQWLAEQMSPAEPVA